MLMIEYLPKEDFYTSYNATYIRINKYLVRFAGVRTYPTTPYTTKKKPIISIYEVSREE